MISPEATIAYLIAAAILGAVAFCYLLNWFHAVKVREFNRGAEFVRREAYRHLINCSLTGYKNAKEILKPRKL